MAKKQQLITPLTVISAFLALVEVALSSTLSKLSGSVQTELTYFTIIFPLLVCIAFFYTLWFRPYVFYPPSEFGKDVGVDEYRNAMTSHPIPPKGDENTETKISDTLILDQLQTQFQEKSKLTKIAEEVVVDEESKDNEPSQWIIAYTQHQYRDAINLLDQVIAKEYAKDNPSPLAYEMFAADALSHIDFNAGVSKFRKLVEEHPGFSQIYLWFADIYQRANLTKEELEIIEEGIKDSADIDRDYLLLRKTEILVNKKQSDEAKQLAKEIISSTTQPSIRSQVHRLVGNILKEQGQNDEANKSFLMAYQATPTDPLCLKEIATFFSDIKNPSSELYFLNLLTELYPANGDNWGYLGNYQYNLGFRDTAMQSYNKGIELEKEKAGWIIGNVGNLLNGLGLFSMAIDKFQEALTTAPDSNYIHQRFADATKGKKDEADKWDEKLRAAKTLVSALLQTLNTQ